MSEGFHNGDLPLRLAYFSQETYGGLADYAREQARALRQAGARVCFVTAPSVAANRSGAADEVLPLLAEVPAASASSRWLRRWRTLAWILGNMRRFAGWLRRERIRYVLFGAYMEYFAPLWVAPYRELARKDVVFGSVVHDPVRSTPWGPRWWRRRSIAANYSFLSETFVHDPIELDTVRPVAGLQTTVIPHGPYPAPPASVPRDALRARWQVPPAGILLLAFGHLRDAKNLDLVLQAMVARPEIYLLVAGKELSASQKPAAYYQDLAQKMGVAHRCRWQIGFVPDQEIGNFFEASDVVLLTYNGGFRSASGVLNIAVQYRKPCLASGGAGNLKTSVLKYKLGEWVEPDDPMAIACGLSPELAARPADWTGYVRDNSWARNAELVLERFRSHSDRG